MSVDVTSVVLRSLSFGTLFQALGASLFALQFEGQLQGAARKMRGLILISALATLLLVCVHYAIEAGRLSGTWDGVFDLELQELVWRSSVRTAWIERSLGVVLIAAATCRRGRVSMLLTWAGVFWTAVSFTAIGHTTEPGASRGLALLLMAHVAVVAFWFGSLIPLLWTTYEEPTRAAAMVEAFSRRAVWLVPSMFAAGAVLAWNLISRWSTFAQPYGLLLLVKVVGFSALMVLAALNRWRYGPGLALDSTALASFRRSVVAEYAIIVMILVVTTVLTSFYSPEPHE